MSRSTELVRERVGIIVTRGLDSYGYFLVQEEERRFVNIAVDLVLKVTDRIDEGEVVGITELKSDIISGLLAFGFDKTVIGDALGRVFASLYAEIFELRLAEPEELRTYRKYEALITGAIADLESLFKSSTEEYLAGIPGYGVASQTVNLGATRSRLLKKNRSAKRNTVIRSRLPETFTAVFDRNVITRADVVSGASPDINAVTSDSKLDMKLPSIDQSLLTATFAGEGNKVYTAISRLYTFAAEFGGYQGSLVGAVDYQSRYYEYVMAMSYGKRLPQGVISGEFGDFEAIFGQKTTRTRIPGLKFLEPIYTTRSGNQSTGSVVPVAAKYGGGLADRYVPPVRENPAAADFVSLTLESVYVLCLKVGDAVRSLLNRPPDGIGNTALHMEVLAEIFPSSTDARIRGTGLTGAIGSLLRAHRSLYGLLGYEPDLHNFNDKFDTVSGIVADLARTLRDIGFRPGGYVPSLALTVHEPDRDRIAKRLAAIGFNPVEVQEIMSAGSMSDLVDRFAPLTDSQDVISFFRAYDLTKLLYEFGGQAAIDRYTDFLYGVNPDTSLLRLLELLDRGRSLASKVRGGEFSRLIGYVVTLTYAVDPAQLATLDSVLRRNNLDLFQSITQLVERGLPTVIKDRDVVSLLSGMVAQMVTLDNSGYESQKPLWNDLIAKSAGNVGPDVAGLYNRAEGITPTELYAYLGGPSATSPVGKLLDGVRGGRMTSLLRYCNLFGLLYSLSGYRNSGQLVNESADRYTTVLEMIDTLENLSERMYLANILVNESAGGDGAVPVYTDPVIQVQNKEFGGMVDLVRGDAAGAVARAIVESPGTGNSRIPNGIRISNSLTPEEAAVIADTGSSLEVFTRAAANPVESGSYIRIAVSNLLASGIDVGAGMGVVTGGIGTVDESPTLPIADYTTTYQNSQPGTGGSDPLANVPAFNPIASCQRFGGGSSCTELGYDPDRLCSRPFSRALYPEDGYGTAGVGGVANVPVDRPLGSSLAGNVTYTTVPLSHPQLPFTANGLSALSRSDVFKDSEMLCASLKDPYQYGACISLLKCKRFDPPYEGRYSFAFCPSTLHGGRLRR